MYVLTNESMHNVCMCIFMRLLGPQARVTKMSIFLHIMFIFVFACWFFVCVVFAWFLPLFAFLLRWTLGLRYLRKPDLGRKNAKHTQDICKTHCALHILGAAMGGPGVWGLAQDLGGFD